MPKQDLTNEDFIQQMTVGTLLTDQGTTSNVGDFLTKYGISPADAVSFLGRAGSVASLALQPSEAKGMTMDEYLAKKQASLSAEESSAFENTAARLLLQALRSKNPAQGTQAAQEIMRVYSGYGDEIKNRFDVNKANPRSDMGRALYASTSPDVASESALGRMSAKGVMPDAPAVYPLDILKQSILFLDQEYPATIVNRLKNLKVDTTVPKGPTVKGEDLYEIIRKLPKNEQGDAVQLLGFKGAQFLPGGKPLASGNFAIFDTDKTVSSLTKEQFAKGGEVSTKDFIRSHA